MGVIFVVFRVTHSQVEEQWNFLVFPPQLIVFGSINPDCNAKEKESGENFKPSLLSLLH